MSDPKLELSVEVPGTPEQVWQAIATGEGIGSWFVPAEVDPVTGGRAVYDFGTYGKSEAEVVAYEPSYRIVLQGEGAFPLRDEWTVETASGDTCIVRLVSTGFHNMPDWDGDVDAFANGWRIFMNNMRLHLAHFPGQAARAIVATTTGPGPNAVAWAKLCDALGVSQQPGEGEQVKAQVDGLPAIVGTVDSVVRTDRVSVTTLVVDEPAPGTVFIAAEGSGEHVACSVYLYLYGERGAQVEDGWTPWLATVFA